MSPLARASAAFTLPHGLAPVLSTADGLSKCVPIAQPLRRQRGKTNGNSSLDSPSCRLINSLLGLLSALIASWGTVGNH